MGPLTGIRVIEMAGLAPSPYCGMLLADFGADVVIVDRLKKHGHELSDYMPRNPFNRGKRSMRVDLKTHEGVKILQRMIRHFDVLIDAYRPGAMEALGLGPEKAAELNPKLVYARLTGFGQIGPYATAAGHDINFIALSGALSLFRNEGGKPVPPCNILGDFAGGGLLCAMGILLALIERNRSGLGQVVDAAMVDGANNLLTLFYGLLANGLMSLDIGSNMLDGAAPYYQTYETADGKWVAVGAIEAKFYAQLLEGLGLDPGSLPHQHDMGQWPEVRKRFASIFKTKTRDEWESIFSERTDACVAPVLALDEAGGHPHNRERELMVTIDGVPQPAPAPRLTRTPGRAVKGQRAGKGVTREILAAVGYSKAEVDGFLKQEVIE